MVKVSGADRVSKRLRGMASERAVRTVTQALFVGGDMIKVEAQISITANSISGAGHIVSAPYDPPNNDSGELANGIENNIVRPLKVEVSSNAPHAIPLEFGTSKMLPRPSMQPATAKKRRAVVELVEKAVSKTIRDAGR